METLGSALQILAADLKLDKSFSCDEMWPRQQFEIDNTVR